jgi:hypothetical protein
MWQKSWLLSEHLAACSCLVIPTNLSEYHQSVKWRELYTVVYTVYPSEGGWNVKFSLVWWMSKGSGRVFFYGNQCNEPRFVLTSFNANWFLSYIQRVSISKYPLFDDHFKCCLIFSGFLQVIYVCIAGLHAYSSDAWRR